MSINVEFKYSLNGEDEWRKLPLTAEEFFDPLEPGEDLDYDCVPIHLDPRKYVAIDPTQIRAVVVGTNDNNGNSNTWTNQYWGDNTFSDTTWNGKTNFQRIIYSLVISEDPYLVLIATTERHEGILRVVHECVLETPSDRLAGSRHPWSPRGDDFWNNNLFARSIGTGWHAVEK